MPLFDFVCQACGERFELLVREQEAPACPKCQARDVTRKISGFAIPRKNSAPTPSASSPTPASAGHNPHHRPHSHAPSGGGTCQDSYVKSLLKKHRG